jgi:diguanylate cyclase (GGDEF)-like protein
MDRRAYLSLKFPSYFVVLVTLLAYVAVFAQYHEQAGIGIASLAILPVMAASWYFGTPGGIVVAVISILSNIFTMALTDYPISDFYKIPGNLIDTFLLIALAFVVGNFTKVMHERQDAILKLEQYERERRSHTHFLEQLNQITAKALEADSLQATLEILTEKLAYLFSANDVFFSRWDTIREVPIPAIAYGSMKDIYPYVQFEPGETTLTGSVIKAERPIPVVNLEDSEYISPNVASVFPSRSMLGIPLIAQDRKLGAILLGYEKTRTFDEEIVFHAELTAEQVALVLSKSQLLEEERKQVRQLTALHDVALVSIEADNEDQLIENVVTLIGQTLFPDNFGILLVDEDNEVLHVHPSYRFYSMENLVMREIRMGEGITGKVAQTGIPQRIGNVRRVRHYLDVDERTTSELCVPIKFKERILGVINAESTKREAFTSDDERLLVTLAGQVATALEQLRKARDEHKLLDQLAHSRDLIYSIAQIITHVEKTLTAEEIIQTLGKKLENIGLTCIMATYDKTQNSFRVNYTSLPPRLLKIVEASLGYPLLEYTFPRRVLESILKPDEILRSMAIADPEEEINTLFIQINKVGISSTLRRIGVTQNTEPLRLPIVFEANLLGILWVWGPAITRSDLPIMSIFARQIGISLERARLFQEVQSLAHTDPLTGLQNRRSLFELGRIEFARAQRMDRPFSCMMLDLDHFKQINDNYGHPVGDQVLQEFARRCAKHVREIDLIGRYGGEELIIFLPETERETAVMVAERLRSAIAATPVRIPNGEINITVSIGLGAMDQNTMQLETLIARADQAMYIAKHKGRNRVAISV